MTSRLDVCARLAALLILAGGCAEDAATLNVTTVLNYNQCQGLEPGLTSVDYAAVAGIRGGTLLGMTQPDDTDPDDDLLLVAISRGQQPTPGYGFTLEEARREGGTAVVSVRWKTPEPGAVLAQMMTHPCLVIGLEPEGLTRVEVVDQTGVSLGTLDL